MFAGGSRRDLDILGRQGRTALLEERSDPSRPGFRIADRLSKELGLMEQSSTLAFLRAQGNGIQHACDLLLAAARADLRQCLLQCWLLEDGIRIRNGLITRSKRLLVLFLCCG